MQLVSCKIFLRQMLCSCFIIDIIIIVTVSPPNSLVGSLDYWSLHVLESYARELLSQCKEMFWKMKANDEMKFKVLPLKLNSNLVSHANYFSLDKKNQSGSSGFNLDFQRAVPTDAKETIFVPHWLGIQPVREKKHVT